MILKIKIQSRVFNLSRSYRLNSNKRPNFQSIRFPAGRFLHRDYHICHHCYNWNVCGLKFPLPQSNYYSMFQRYHRSDSQEVLKLSLIWMTSFFCLILCLILYESKFTCTASYEKLTTKLFGSKPFTKGFSWVVSPSNGIPVGVTFLL